MSLKKLQENFHNLSKREKRLVSLTGLFVFICFMWLFLLEPAFLTLQNANQRQLKLVEKVAEVNRLAQSLEQLNNTNTYTRSRSTNNLSHFNQLLTRFGLDETANTQITSTNEVEITFNQSPVTSVLRLIMEIERKSAMELNYSKLEKSEAGQVSGSAKLSTNLQGKGG